MTEPSPPKRVGRPKDPQKRQAILDAARQLFVQGDFERVTMDEIASRANVSKLTVYSHFGEKEVLFAEAVRDYADKNLSPSLTDIDPSLPIDKALMQLATNYFRNVMNDEAIAGYRMTVSHRVQQTILPGMIWREGPERLLHSVAQWLQSRPELSMDNPADAADMLLSSIRGFRHHAKVFGQVWAAGTQDPQERLRHVVKRFIKAYSP